MLVIGVLFASFGRGKSAERRRSEAAELREQAMAAKEEAQVRETEAATTRTKVEEAKVRADELSQRADEQQQEATQLSDDARERLVKADRIDPDVDENRDFTETDRPDDHGNDDALRKDAPKTRRRT